MKVKQSLVTRRRFLNGMLGGWLGVLTAAVFLPLIRFVFPPTREPEQTALPLADFEDMPANSVRGFAWGSKPGLLKKNDDGTLSAFVAVCTHLDCNVTYLPERRRFYCACHEGWYDENGVNIAGPPPTPLRTLGIRTEEGSLIIHRKGAEEG